MSENVPVVQSARTPATIAMNKQGLQLKTLEDAYRFAQYVIKAGLAPSSIKTPEQALVSMQAGAELGFSPMRSLAVVTVINGRAGLMGEAALAKIRAAGICDQPPVITVRGDGDSREGVMRFKRRDMPEPVEVTFTVAEAKKAKLWGKSGPWSDYPDGQLQWRAVGRGWKLYFSDVGAGFAVSEELHDYPESARPEVRDITPPAEPDPLLAATATREPEPATGEGPCWEPMAGDGRCGLAHGHKGAHVVEADDFALSPE